MPDKSIDTAFLVKLDGLLDSLTLASVGNGRGRVIHEVGAQDGWGDADILLHPFQAGQFLLTGNVVRAVLRLNILEELLGPGSGSLVNVVVGQSGGQRRGKKRKERKSGEHDGTRELEERKDE